MHDVLARLLRDPLTHFLALGGIVFALWAALDTAPADNPAGTVSAAPVSVPDSRDILIDAAEQRLLTAYFTAQWRRLPTEAEFRELLDARIREEVLMREALALGLDRGDRVIRQRLAQKLEMTLREVAALETPTEAELAAFHARHRDRYALPPRISLTHRFVSARQHGDAAAARAAALLHALQSGDDVSADPFHAPGILLAETPDRLARVFGNTFRDAVLAAIQDGQPIGRWTGPVASPWGIHVVRIDDYQPGRQRGFAESRAAVEQDWREDAQAAAEVRRIELMRRRYRVEIAPFDPATERLQ
ncbi:MAG: peptidyl-prolyl cis-trans isomerase [Pseudomonadales bacterium]|nr:peptidyl-prolyl cis-trans isomerase [Pseudomonadales bacterium]